MRKNCSSDREKLLKFEAEGREFANFLGYNLDQFIQKVKGQNAFLTCSWRFLIPKELEQLGFILKKNVLEYRNMQEKIEKIDSLTDVRNPKRKKWQTAILSRVYIGRKK